MNDTITITAGRPNRQGNEQDFAGPDGTYTVTLIAVSDEVTEQSTMPSKRKNDDGTWTYRDWTVAIDGGTEWDGQVLDIRANARSSGPKSKQFGIIAAFAGKLPTPGTVVSIPKLVGRQALALIVTNESDYPTVDKLMALPAARQAPAPVAEPAPEPASEPIKPPLREAVAATAGADDLPWS